MRSLQETEMERASEYLLGTGIVHETPIEFNTNMYPELGLYFKREDTQDVKSFKIRGALNSISLLSEEQRAKGLVCASAGNHAQGFAVACKYFQCRGTVFMPEAAPDVKVQATQQFGGEYIDIKLVPGGFDEVRVASESFTKQEGATYIHPFNDVGVMIGASTVGYEIFEQMKSIGKHVDYIVAPVGGGGLVAGLISAKNVFSPHTQIIGAESLGHASMKRSLSKGYISTVAHKNSTRFADGVAVAQVGNETFEIAKQDDLHIIGVGKDRIATYMEKLLQQENPMELEASGALAIAAVGQEIDTFRGKVVVCVLSGANIDDSRREAVPVLAKSHRDYRAEGGRKPV